MAASERIFKFLDEKTNVKEKPNVKPLTDMKGHIEFDHVHLPYDEQRITLRDINLELKQGQIVALVGHTGSGKSTIANLIRPNQGFSED